MLQIAGGILIAVLVLFLIGVLFEVFRGHGEEGCGCFVLIVVGVILLFFFGVV